MSRVRVPDGAPNGPLVKRLRQRPLTPLTWVRFPHGSPKSLLKEGLVLPETGENRIVGVDDGEGPPVPIPNTEVKLTGAEDTWLATAWNNRKMPT